jgi:hypothetical protein
MIKANPDTTVRQVMSRLKVKKPYGYNLMSVARKYLEQEPTAELPVVMLSTPDDVVNHPAHYKVGGIETIDFIEAKGLNYHLGNVIKYITRADYKGDRIENLKKAQWYLTREIESAAR